MEEDNYITNKYLYYCLVLAVVLIITNIIVIALAIRHDLKNYDSWFKEKHASLKWGKVLLDFEKVEEQELSVTEFETYLRLLKLSSPQLLKWMRHARCSSRKSQRNAAAVVRHPDLELVNTAWHEAGHVVAFWFTMNPGNIKFATIVPTKTYSGAVMQECLIDNSSPDGWFSDMCCIMGGEVASQMFTIYKQTLTLELMHSDIVHLSTAARELAELTASETTEEIDLIKLMYFYFRKCYEVTLELLRKHEKDVRAVAKALLKEKVLNHEAILGILGPRPQMEKTFYKQFVEGQFYLNEHTTLPNRSRCAYAARRSSSLKKLFRKSPMIRHFITVLQNKLAFIKRRSKRKWIKIVCGLKRYVKRTIKLKTKSKNSN